MNMTRWLIWPTIVLAVSCSASSQNVPEEPTRAEEVEVEADNETETTAQNVADDASTLELGRVATRKFYDGELEALYTRFSEEMQAAMTLEKWKAIHAQIAEGLGEETELLGESESNVLDDRIYRRQVRFEKNPDGLLELSWRFGVDGTIRSFGVAEPEKPAESDYLDYRSKTAFMPPFEGEWTVVWGGRTIEQNYHAKAPSQRFALDLLVTDEHGKSHTGDGEKNADYYAFGEKILAPGPGKVISVANDVRDNKPGEKNPEQLIGNHVFIDHGNGEYSLIAHLQEGTVAVKIGDKVESGTLLGRVGNSGNTTEPHIHYHVETGPKPLKGQGLPIQFETAFVDGEVREDVEWVQGMKVAPAPTRE